MYMLGNFGAKRNFIILCFMPPRWPKIVSAPLRGLIFIDTAIKFTIFQKIWNIDRNMMCFIINVIIARQNFSAILIYLSFSKFSYRQYMF